MAKVIIRDMNGEMFFRNELIGIDLKKSTTHDFRMIITAKDLVSTWDINFKDLSTFYKKDEIKVEEVDLIDFIYDKMDTIKVLSVEGDNGHVIINFR